MFLKDSKHDLKLSEFITRKKKSSVICEYFVSLFSFDQMKLSIRSINRIKELLMNSSFVEMKSLVLSLNAHLEFLISKERYSDVIKLLFQYKHLNSSDLIDFSVIDLIMHRIRLTSDTKLSFRSQKKWSSQKKWWLRKLVQQEVDENVYERTNKRDDRLFFWNAQIVLVDKMKNSKSNDEFRMTFDFSRVIEELSETHMSLMFSCHDYLSNFNHECFMMTNLKHAYLMIQVHFDDRHYFAFIISDIEQLQLTRMHQRFMIASFIMSKLMIKILNKLSHLEKSESSLLQNAIVNDSSLVTFYQDDILEKHRSFENQFAFLRDHFLSRIEWSRLRLTFKKLYFFQKTVKALEITHTVNEKIRILNERCEKMINFLIFTISTDVRVFLRIIEIIRRWILNFSKLKRSLTRLTRKIDWRWTSFEQLFFEILRIKCSIATMIHEINYFEIIHFYIDAFMYDEDLIITQFRQKNEKIVEISILYDVYTFNSTERKYLVYKKELCVLIKSVMKYDHFCKHLINTTIIHTDHKSLIHFLEFDRHEEIYEHWADKMRDLNIKIRYVSERRNKVADELSRTIFRKEDCSFDFEMKFALRFLRDEESV
jgi:hypothetical protein